MWHRVGMAESQKAGSLHRYIVENNERECVDPLEKRNKEFVLWWNAHGSDARDNANLGISACVFQSSNFTQALISYRELPENFQDIKLYLMQSTRFKSETCRYIAARLTQLRTTMIRNSLIEESLLCLPSSLVVLVCDYAEPHVWDHLETYAQQNAGVKESVFLETERYAHEVFFTWETNCVDVFMSCSPGLLIEFEKVKNKSLGSVLFTQLRDLDKAAVAWTAFQHCVPMLQRIHRQKFS